MSGSKVVRYKRRPRAVAFIFALVLIYIICFVVLYISKSKVQTYEVNTGSLTNNAVYTAIALRSESVYYSPYSGNINYYQRENTRVKKGDTVYSVDETGRVSDILAGYNKVGENSLSKQNLADIKSTLNNYKNDYDGSDFSYIYDLKSDLNAAVLQSINENIMNNIDSIIESTGSRDLFRTIPAETNGIVVYSVDGYESKEPETITSSDFNKDNYNKSNLKAESIMVTGNPAYKMVTSENWYLMIKLNHDDISKYGLQSKKTIDIKVKKDNMTFTCGFSIIEKGDGIYGRLSLDSYMIRYASERFLDIELVTTGKSGMKIPVSSVTENDFYEIPKSYMTKGGNSNNYGFIVEKYDENGNIVPSFAEADIYKTTDEYVYVNKESFESGQVIVMPDSSSRFVIGPVAKLKGVYCVNTGYTIFCPVEILDQNNEYYIVKQKITHGITVYDRILLEADKYKPNEMIY
ncbi:MAG TPA: hypothetical protein DE316_00870 [Eubacterium sp.]|nr:hypothetical protein [Eubacterium sp.]